jgi:hypothetical protein
MQASGTMGILWVPYDVQLVSNSTGPSKSTQQWGLKPLKEELMKDEIISYNEG